ncbi:putative phage tail tape measure protein [Methanobrevibacter arboriphilus JCM 13429 = DSM 1125]|uniref:Putative phage tail tape measure protein n=1 Tax=Methanobrevibacter arboriphilus JCM 13429 = DSM 1125 TaxID=1300164 RepID=A0A1V6N252_METAZ|nr:hypothetical protein [Methanobrevibacter arboriphilus]OQD58697.1 putative phage tail tape measure protein [Methanobrevibacter arboriphilus JCM 13429 = DSM 1125]
MAHLDDLIIRIKAILDSGGFDQAANKVKDVGDTANRASNDLAKMGNDGRSSFMQLQYGANTSLSSVNKNLQSVDTNSTGLWSNIKQGASSAWSSVKESASSAWSNIKSGASSAASSIANNFSNIKSTVGNAMEGMQGVGGLVAGGLGAVGLGAVSDIVVNTSAKAETNKILLKNMTQTQKGADTLFKTVDNATNKTLVSMQQVIPALNAFKAATAANEQQLNATAPGVAQFGSFVYAMTGSAAKAETAMFDLSKGIKGAYASLDQYGITEDALMRTGLWTGKTDDVEGYIAAVNQVTGSTDELMGTFTGLQATVGKIFSIAGKQLGQDVLPVLKNILQGFIDFNEETGGNLTRGILTFVGVLGLLLSVGTAASFIWPLITAGASVFGGVLSLVTGALGMNTTAMTLSAIANGQATVSWGALTAAMLANPVFWIAAVILGVAAAIVILKTQTDLLDSASDKAGKSMQTLNNRLEMLKGQEKAASKNIEQLKNKLDTLDKSSAEYETVYKNYQSEKDKLDKIKADIAAINGAKATISVTVQKAEVDSYNRSKADPKKLEAAGVTQYQSGNPQDLANIYKQSGQLAYYNSLANKSTKTFNGLTDAQLKTFDGKRLGQYSQKMSEVADIESKITKDIQENKEPSWMDQMALSKAKKELDEMAGINPWDSEDMRIKKRDAMANNDMSLFTEGSIVKQFENAGKWIENGFNTLKQLMLNRAADMTKDIPIIGDFFENLKGNKGDIGAAIVKTIQDIDWAGLGSDVGGKLIEGIKGMIESMPIIGDIMRLLEGGSSSLSTGGENSNTSGNGFSIPQLNWGNFISLWGIGDWAGKISNWSGWASKINQWAGWASKINQWTNWSSKITNWSNWSSKITTWSNWSSKITAVNLANYVLGAFGAGGDEIGAGGDVETSSVSSSSVTTKSVVKSSKNSKKVIIAPVIKDAVITEKVDIDELISRITGQIYAEVEAKGIL